MYPGLSNCKTVLKRSPSQSDSLETAVDDSIRQNLGQGGGFRPLFEEHGCCITARCAPAT